MTTVWEIWHKLSQVPEIVIELGDCRKLHIKSWSLQNPSINQSEESESKNMDDRIELTVKISGAIYQLNDEGCYLNHENLGAAFNTLGRFPSNPINLGDKRELLISQWKPSVHDPLNSGKPCLLDVEIEGIIRLKGVEE